MPRPFFVDTDTASDDAVALVMALRHPDVDVVGIGVVAGNVPLPRPCRTRSYTVELCGSHGAGPRRRSALRSCSPLETAQHVHGVDGMGDIGLHLSGREPSGVACRRRPARGVAPSTPGTLTLVTLGPLTNVARALQRDPTLPERIARCVVMGAVADHVGNANPVAEFNMWVDPHAVDVVLRSGLAVEFVGWDISRHYAVLDPADAAAIRAIGTPLAEFCIDIQGVVNTFALHETKLAGFDLPDPIAMAYAIDPSVATETRRLHCEVETAGTVTRGMVVMDLLGLTDASRTPWS